MAAPAAPTGVLGTAGYGCAQVRWKAPVSTPQPASYTVTTSPADVAPITIIALTSTTKPPVVLTIGGLDNDVEYTFTVTATNTDGTSVASAAVVLTPRDFNDGLMNTLSFLTGKVSRDFVDKLGQNPPVMWIGPQYLTDRDDGQRIVFIPRGGRIVPGELLGDDDDWSGMEDETPEPRQIWDALEEVEAHIWGLQLPDSDPMRDTIASYAQARFIMNRLLASLHSATIASNISISNAFPVGRDKTTRGAAIIVKFQLKIPVTRYSKATGVIEAAAQTVEIEEPP